MRDFKIFLSVPKPKIDHDGSRLRFELLDDLRIMNAKEAEAIAQNILGLFEPDQDIQVEVEVCGYSSEVPQGPLKPDKEFYSLHLKGTDQTPIIIRVEKTPKIH